MLLTVSASPQYRSRMDKPDAIARLSALAQEHRLDVFRLLVQVGEEGLPAGEIAQALGIATNSLSFHLDRLRHAELVTQRRQGRSLIYAANYAAMDGLLAYLTENCCAGLPDCCAPGDKPAKAKTAEPRKRRRVSA